MRVPSRGQPRRRCILQASAIVALLQIVAFYWPTGFTQQIYSVDAGPLPRGRRVADLPLEVPVQLTVSSPAVLLNHVADRYTSTSRILMEFVDNAFDDAESFFDSASNNYSRPVLVEVLIDRKGSGLRITDNCRGMEPDMLRRVTTHVGESKKRGQSFVNGQFGFGMQAFRACCQTLTVRSRTVPGERAKEIAIHRDQSLGFSLREVGDEEDFAMPETGTSVHLGGFEGVWSQGENELSVQAFAKEIEVHFERLLSRGNLEVTVVDGDTGERYVCQPVMYAIDGDNATQVIIDERIELSGGQVAHALLGVASVAKAEEIKRPARFFVKGRRIGAISEIRSFFKGSRNRWTVWSHPQVMGYIDVLGDDNGPLRPVITRDEFKNVEGRQVAFAAIMEVCEERMLQAIEKVNTKRNDKSMKGLEDVMNSALSKISADERRERNKKPELTDLGDLDSPGPGVNISAPANFSLAPVIAASSERPKRKPQKQSDPEKPRKPYQLKKLRVDDFRVKLVRGLGHVSGTEAAPRSAMRGNEILVDVQHSDFTTRFKKTRHGAPRLDERVCSYLATVVSAHYRDASYSEFDEAPESRLRAYEDMIHTYCQLEERLRMALPILSKEMEMIYAKEAE